MGLRGASADGAAVAAPEEVGEGGTGWWGSVSCLQCPSTPQEEGQEWPGWGPSHQRHLPPPSVGPAESSRRSQGCPREGVCWGESPDVNPSPAARWSSPSRSPATVCVTGRGQFWAQWGLWEALVLPEPTSHLSCLLPGVPAHLEATPARFLTIGCRSGRFTGPGQESPLKHPQCPSWHGLCPASASSAGKRAR